MDTFSELVSTDTYSMCSIWFLMQHFNQQYLIFLQKVGINAAVNTEGMFRRHLKMPNDIKEE